MRLVTPFTVLVFVVVWTIIFLCFARYFLFSAHESWFEKEERRFLGEVGLKIDNLDTRNLRQLNQIYAEVKKLEDSVHYVKNCVQFGNCSLGRSARQVEGDPPPNSPSLEARGIEATLEPSIPILVIACNRPDYVVQTLDSLLRYRPSAGLFPIIVSQDCGHAPTAQAIAKYGSRVNHLKHPDLSDPVVSPERKKTLKNSSALKGYMKISRHYKWALSQIFDEMKYAYAIIVEDDLETAPDFFSYFSSLLPVLTSDPNTWCISAWNDNGKEGYISLAHNDLLYRTDFFPGLGWMLTKELWEELKPKWPDAFWDDWMREPEQTLGRSCVRPEVSRTRTFGAKGVSGGQWWKQHLQYIVLNPNPVDFSSKNLSYITEAVYEVKFVQRVLSLPSVDLNDVLYGRQSTLKEVQLKYNGRKDYERIAKAVKIMYDFRGGVPRTAYKGIVSFIFKGRRVHLTPRQPWHGYQSLPP